MIMFDIKPVMKRPLRCANVGNNLGLRPVYFFRYFLRPQNMNVAAHDSIHNILKLRVKRIGWLCRFALNCTFSTGMQFALVS